MTTECKVCGEESEKSWRCTECGKPFETSDKSGRGEVQRR